MVVCFYNLSIGRPRSVGRWENLVFLSFTPLVQGLKEGPANAKHEWHPCRCPGEAGAIREYEDSLDYLDSNSESPDSADKM